MVYSSGIDGEVGSSSSECCCCAPPPAIAGPAPVPPSPAATSIFRRGFVSFFAEASFAAFAIASPCRCVFCGFFHGGSGGFFGFFGFVPGGFCCFFGFVLGSFFVAINLVDSLKVFAFLFDRNLYSTWCRLVVEVAISTSRICIDENDFTILMVIKFATLHFRFGARLDKTTVVADVYTLGVLASCSKGWECCSQGNKSSGFFCFGERQQQVFGDADGDAFPLESIVVDGFATG